MKTMIILVFMLFSAAIFAQQKNLKGIVDVKYTMSDKEFEINKIEATAGCGYQFNRMFYVGAGTGVSFPLDYKYIFIPLYIDARFYCLKEIVTPVLFLRTGYEFCLQVEGFVNDGKLNGKGWFIEPSIGLRVKSFIIGAGYKFKKETYDPFTGYFLQQNRDKKLTNYGSIVLRIGYEF